MKVSKNNIEINQFLSSFSYLVKKKRLEKNWTQYKLSKESNCSFGIVKSIEKNEKTNYKVMTIKKISSALNIPMNDIFNFKNNQISKD